MAETKKVVFKGILGDDKKEFTLAILTPDAEREEQARYDYNRAFKAALQSGALLRAKINDYMREQNLWGDEKQAELEKLGAEVNKGELRLKKGGFKFNEARELALEMRTNRFKIASLLSARNSLDTHSAEGQAEDAKFKKLLQLCLVYNDTGKPVYKDVKTLLDSKDVVVPEKEDDKDLRISAKAYDELANMYYGLDPDFDSKLPENKWLKEWNQVDDKYRLINKDGHLIDVSGRLINEDGRLVNEKGELIDGEGNHVDKDGEFVVEKQPFLDEDGNPITPPVKN